MEKEPIRVIHQNVKLLTISNPLKRIEYAGRICYQSLDKIKPGSDWKFVCNLVKHGHMTPLEHAYFGVPAKLFSQDQLAHVWSKDSDSPFLQHVFCKQDGNKVYGTLRAFLNAGLDLEKVKPYMTRNCKDFVTFVITTDRGVATEFYRHRSIAYDDQGYEVGARSLARFEEIEDPVLNQTSTRYIDLSKKPAEIVLPEPMMTEEDSEGADYYFWYHSCKSSIQTYLQLILNGNPPQFARNVLPLSIACTMVMSAHLPVWHALLKLRLAKGAHPQARYLAYQLWKTGLRRLSQEQGYSIDEIEALYNTVVHDYHYFLQGDEHGK